MVSDCCHSGGMLDHQEIVIAGEHGTATSRRMKVRDRGISVDEVLAESDVLKNAKEKKNRSIDLDTMAGMMQEQKPDIKPANPQNIRQAPLSFAPIPSMTFKLLTLYILGPYTTYACFTGKP